MKFVRLLAAAVLAAFAMPALAQERVVLPTNVVPDRYEIRVRPNAEALTFSGEETIALTVKTATDRIVLNAADLTIRKASLAGVAAAPRMVRDEKQETVAFVFAKPLAPGQYRLSLTYDGKIWEQASGLFALDYDTPQGKKRALFTQFENSDARRFAPMWDEPGVKSVFSLTVEAPAGQMAVSNMPVAKTTPVAGGRQAVTFADSPKMSSYLLFLGLGEFERIHKQVGPTDVGVVVRKGDAAKGEFALDAAVKLLDYFNDYFGTPYPLPKLDLVAGPGRSQFFGAMENWGAIFYFDYYLLLDPKLSSEADRQQVFIVIAHEMAHQWFGDLVTMAWWDDLWLNEGFASWMENKATDALHPEWKVWLQTQDGQQGAMRLDARGGTHPVITPIVDVFAAASAFDSITYSKGQAVIRMLEAYVGEDAFRQGVRNYIAKHKYANTVTDDLWAEIDAVSKRPITDIAHDFTLQAGVPLIRADAVAGGVRLSQDRFAADASQKAAQSWRTPVAVDVLGSQAAWLGVVSAAAPKTAPAPNDAPVVVNAGQTGYFRTLYDEALWGRIAPRFASLAPADQLGLLFDSLALGEAGYAPMSRFLELSLAAAPSADPVVQQTLADRLLAVDALYDGRPGQAAFRAFARARLAPLFARVGWAPKAGESDNDAVLRGVLIRALGQFDDPEVLAESRRRFEASLSQPDSLTGSVRAAVIRTVAAHADAAVWEQLHRMARTATDVTDRQRLYAYLGSARDPALADRALALALSDEPKKTDAPSIIGAAAAVDAVKAFDFALAHRAQVEALLEPTSRVTYFTQLATGANDRAMLDRLAAFRATVPASTAGEVEKAAAAIRYRIDTADQRLPEVDRWLAARR